MATAKPLAPTLPSRLLAQRRVRKLALVLAAASVALLAWFWQPMRSYAVTAASYGARIGCSCRFVEGRELGDCRADFEPGMMLVRLAEDGRAKTISASFPLLARQTATYAAGQGCLLERWPD